MKLLLISLITFVVSAGVRGDKDTFDAIDWSAHQWQAPLPTDSRGPCPGLNTLANHGFLPRNGSNITIPVVLNAIKDGFNFYPTNLLRTAAKIGLLATENADNFSLEELALHGTLEHDVSLSRSDLSCGDHIHFNATVFATLKNSNPGVDYYNATSAGQVLVQRLAEETILSPNLTNTVKELTVRIVESGFYLSVMGNVTTGAAPKKFVQILFEQERLPIEEGWHRSEVPIMDDNFGTLIMAIGKATTWAPSGNIVCPWIRLQPEGYVSIIPPVPGTDRNADDEITNPYIESNPVFFIQ
ncbi:Peroxidase, family 2-domain-containing protein [Rhodocollybia butyracea]|uniref:Peroxidase, family 2-domain-containing protein n=1 Tax=Rhodocollybia butyracea TaxID=206335 RepID=A0A9P5U7E7_9AGAR|nr:Peroxidase, family 2-domain-containing protein [Rhodocollybia butyracea]